MNSVITLYVQVLNSQIFAQLNKYMKTSFAENENMPVEHVRCFQVSLKYIFQVGLETPGCRKEPKAFPNNDDLI